MARTNYKKKMVAGRLVKTVLYSVPQAKDEKKVREAKQKVSSEARQRMNLRASWEKLEMTLAANFGYRDLVLTLTYLDKYLPPNREAAVKLLKKFIAQLRAEYKKRGYVLKYIYVTEDKHGDGRIHHHLVINGTGNDYELIKSLWIYGDNVHFEPVEIKGYEALARYLTKEPREYGKTEVGKRTWTPSKGLTKPKTEGEYVDDDITLIAPPGAVVLDRSEKNNEFGTFIYLKYLLPDKGEKRIDPLIISDLEQCITSEMLL